MDELDSSLVPDKNLILAGVLAKSGNELGKLQKKSVFFYSGQSAKAFRPYIRQIFQETIYLYNDNNYII